MSVRATEDADYGALLLEALGDGCTDPRRKAALYDHASRRAAAFAAGATSGGEGLARMLDVDRLAKKRAEPGHAGDPVPRPAGSNSPRTQE